MQVSCRVVLFFCRALVLHTRAQGPLRLPRTQTGGNRRYSTDPSPQHSLRITGRGFEVEMPAVCCTSPGHALVPGLSRSVVLLAAARDRTRPAVWPPPVTFGNMWWENLPLPRNTSCPRALSAPHWERTGTTTAPRQCLQEGIADHQHTQHHRALPQNLTGPARASGGTTPTTTNCRTD